MIRFVHVFNYSAGVSRSDGEKWYLGTHVPAVKKLPGMRRYRSWPRVEVGIPYPSPGAPTPFDQFVRRTELCFDDYDPWRNAYRSNPGLWTPASERTPGFGPFECMFLDEEPQFDLLRDAPAAVQVHDAAAMVAEGKARGRRGRGNLHRQLLPALSAHDFIDDRRGLVPRPSHPRRQAALGDEALQDLAHNPRPSGAGALFQPNKWTRLTELGMSPAAYIADMVNEGPGSASPGRRTARSWRSSADGSTSRLSRR